MSENQVSECNLECPHCHHSLKQSIHQAGRNDGTPYKPGDIGLCVHCNNVFVLDEALKAREVTPQDIENITKSCGIGFVLAIAKARFENHLRLQEQHRQNERDQGERGFVE